MELHFTLIAPDRGRRASYELVATIERGASCAELADELDRLFGARGITVEGRPLASLMAGAPPLRSGAFLLARSAGRTAPPGPEAPLVLGVRTGPGAGSVFALHRGGHTLGRGPESSRAAIALPDPELSREHARLVVTETSVRLIDAGSRNGTSLDGRRIREAVVARGQILRMGSSTASLEVPEGSPLHASAGRPHGDPLRVIRPSSGRPRLALLAMAAVPLILGVGMAALTGQWMFLAMSGVSAGAALLPLAEGRAARQGFAQDLARAVADDLERRLRAAPDAYEISTHTAGAALGGPDDMVMLRVGTGRQQADVVVEPPHGSPLPEHEAAPVVVPFAARGPASGLVTVRGPSRLVEGHCRFLLLQLAALPAASGLPVLMAGGSTDLRLAARFLPRVRILSDAESDDPSLMKSALTTDVQCRVLVLPGLAPAASRSIVEAALTLGRPVIDATQGMDSQELEIDLGRSPARLTAHGAKTDFVADLVPQRAFAAAARHLGALGETDDAGALPSRCRLDRVVGLTERELTAAWAQEKAPNASVPVPLGLTQTGPLILDLATDGPHVLIAGTTGSGKSELLRSLVASAAASHSPHRLTFLFVDFKGGSGLGPLTGIPHCVGLVSDLAGEIDRTLVSLRAEVVRRERIFAEAGCADIVDYQRLGGGREAMPRLALVIDEFRMLVEENPDALAEFLRIASIGRSLGLHLVMATQRPRGAVSADIRANVGSVIALRVAGESESRDVIGSARAARLPAGAPGRALLACGACDPVEFQTASLGLAGEAAANRPLRVVGADEWLEGRQSALDESGPLTPAEAAAGFVQTACRAWRAVGGRPPRRPLADPLPQTAGSPGPAAGRSVSLGVADLPHEQRTAVLDWIPEVHGHLALVGDPAAGTGRALAAVLGQVAGAGPLRYVYLLDADGSLAALKDHPRVGAHVRPAELRDATRLIGLLAQEVSTRGESEQPTLILAVSGWGSWIAALRSGGHSATEDSLVELIRGGPSRHVFVVVLGTRDLVASRVFSELPSRLFFPWGTTEEARLGWPRAVGTAVPGRAIAAGLIANEHSLAVQCFDVLPATRPSSDETGTPPFRIRSLPTEITAAQLSGKLDGIRSAQGSQTQLVAGSRPGQRSGPWLTVGVHGDDCQPLALALPPRGVLLVLGTRQCGKTSLLNALPAMNPGKASWYRARDAAASGAPGTPKNAGTSEGPRPLEITPAHGAPRPPEDPPTHEAPRPPENPPTYGAPASSGAPSSLAASSAAAARAARAGRRAVLLVDDADCLSPEENGLLHEALDAGASVVATAQYSASLYSTCPISLRARDVKSGIAIAPRAPSDGDVFGVRLDPMGRVPPGRAIAVIDGRPIDVQLGWLGNEPLGSPR